MGIGMATHASLSKWLRQPSIDGKQRRKQREKLAAITVTSKQRLSIDVNTLLKPYERVQARPLKNQPTWTTEQYETAAKLAKTLDQQLTNKLKREQATVHRAKDTHLGTVIDENDAQVKKIEFDIVKFKQGLADDDKIRKHEEKLSVARNKVRTFRRTMTRHQDEELKRILECHLGFSGDISEDLVDKILLDLYTGGQFNEARKWIQGYRGQAQHKTLAYIRVMMLDTIKRLGGGNLQRGLKRWDRAGIEEQCRFIMAMFDQGKVRVCLNAFPYEFNAVDFVTIFCHADEELEKWASMVKTKFFTLVRSVVDNVLRVPEGDDVAESAGLTALFRHWKHHMNSDGINALNLGSIDELPTLPSRNASKASSNIRLHEEAAEVYTVVHRRA